MSPLAFQLIAENRKTKNPRLDLGNCTLMNLPEELGECEWLEELILSAKWHEYTSKEQGWRQRESLNKSQINKIANILIVGNLERLKKLIIAGEWYSKWILSDITPLSNLNNLQYIDFSGTQVSDLTPLANLKKLQQVICRNTQVYDLSPLKNLTNLVVFNCASTQVDNLTPLLQLFNLQHLNCSGTKINSLTPLEGLTNLEHLDCAGTKISDLTPLSKLNCLQYLDCSGTHITDLSALANLIYLRKLTCSNTGITDLRPLSNLNNLEKFQCRKTGVSDLSPVLTFIDKGINISWGKTKSQRDFDFTDCPLTIPPIEIVQQGNNAMLNYFQERQTQGTVKLREAKMLIVGEGGAGKTSLLRRLYQKEKPLPEENESTKGIEIHRHDFKMTDGSDFRLNVWDFGGQEIYHATHQFFLTKRSLYVLLDDTRSNHKTIHDSGFKYWLEVIDLLSDHSPVLIFQNEKSGRSKSIDVEGIKTKFGNVRDVWSGNLERIGAANTLGDAIEYYARNLSHIGEELPAKWVSIRAEMEALAQTTPHISQKQYYDIYARHLEFDRTKALHLSRYFHDLGVFLHFQDDDLLSRTVILQNTWATEAVFKMLDDEIVKQRFGRFDRNDCVRVWSASEYADMHPELLALMEKFELCYRLPDSDLWLAPQLLPPSKPDALKNWEKAGDLVLRFRYEFLPKGLVNRLMVRKHQFVRQPERGWVSGVFFEHDNAELLAEIPEQGNEIMLRARGVERKELISIISADLEALNATFHGLSDRVSKWVPCCCSKCQLLAQPEFFDQKRLLQRKKDGKLLVECPGSYEETSVLEMLDGIRVEEFPDWAGVTAPKHSGENSSQSSTRHFIKIFLASSSELKIEREKIELEINRKNKKLQKRGFFLYLSIWEDGECIGKSFRSQDNYNQEVESCDIFTLMFYSKVGKFSKEEFLIAKKCFKQKQHPRILIFQKDSDLPLNHSREDATSRFDFLDELKSEEHFPVQFENIDALLRALDDSLDKLIEDEDFLKKVNSPSPLTPQT